MGRGEELPAQCFKSTLFAAGREQGWELSVQWGKVKGSHVG